MLLFCTIFQPEIKDDEQLFRTLSFVHSPSHWRACTHKHPRDRERFLTLKRPLKITIMADCWWSILSKFVKIYSPWIFHPMKGSGFHPCKFKVEVRFIHTHTHEIISERGSSHYGQEGVIRHTEGVSLAEEKGFGRHMRQRLGFHVWKSPTEQRAERFRHS